MMNDYLVAVLVIDHGWNRLEKPMIAKQERTVELERHLHESKSIHIE